MPRLTDALARWRKYWDGDVARTILEAAAYGLLMSSEPIDMLLFCPRCHAQHVDGQHEPEGDGWDNPPHRSHLCHSCGTIWRPADVATNGVARIETVGKKDTWGRRDASYRRGA